MRPWSPSVLRLLLLVCSHSDSAVRVQHHLGTADNGHQQEEAEEEEEEEGKTKVHIQIQSGHGEDRRVQIHKRLGKMPVYFTIVFFYCFILSPKNVFSICRNSSSPLGWSFYMRIPSYKLNNSVLCLGLFFFFKHWHLQFSSKKQDGVVDTQSPIWHLCPAWIVNRFGNDQAVPPMRTPGHLSGHFRRRDLWRRWHLNKSHWIPGQYKVYDARQHGRKM